jgi:vanillate O-demethylase monooxygenase subunit
MTVADRVSAPSAAPTVAPKSVLDVPLVKNRWYLGAFSGEIVHQPFQRWIADEAIVFYRTEADGTVTALADRCPHRKYPLSKGRLIGDDLRCGYHGFTFDPSGRCVSVPGQTQIPASTKLRQYPVVEQDGIVWVWPGDPAQADPATIARMPWITEWTSITGYAHLRARAILLVDNLLDLSHETFLHPTSIGQTEVAETPIAVEERDGVVYVSRRMHGVDCPPFYVNATGMQGLIDRWQDIEFRPPGLYVLHIRVAPSGQTDGGYHMKVLYGITPETARTTHDFWIVSRDFARDNAIISESVGRQQAAVVDEDVEALDAVEVMVASEPVRTPEVSIGIDRGGLVARRLISELAKREAAMPRS